ncbi:hypothetical protein M9458_039474 [Cirrhinus mrigala]|uniref:Septin-type G domain-containing protein n=1 Tax=Cirrhinus mrigala TaxID=683832 RepID=A0ABD0NR34_CIRMR
MKKGQKKITKGKVLSSGKDFNVAHDIRNNWSRKTEGGSNENLHLKPMFKLSLDETWQSIDGFRRRSTFGKSVTKENKTIMMIGATGAGKTTLINSMINYILGVQWKDDFRFVLIDEGKQQSQAESQTSEITAYQINHMDGFRVPYSLTIVDTPGFGDTRGISLQASLACLTHTQKYIFDSILSVFGKDIAQNILVLVTFAHGKTPPVLEAIKVSEVPCSTNESREPLHFKFNNSAVFATTYTSADDEESDCENVDQMFWKMGFCSMKKFVTSLNTMKTQSLSLTREKYKWDYVPAKRKETYQEIKKRYEDAYGQVMSKEKIFEELEKEFQVVQKIVAELIEGYQKSFERLQEIPLKPNLLSTPDYIDLMIESEKKEAKPGFQDRIQSLMEVRKKAEIISKVSTGGVLPNDCNNYIPETKRKKKSIL